MIRLFREADKVAVSELIRITIETSNVADYPLDRLRPLINYFTPAEVAELNQERHCLVAEQVGRIIGTAAVEGDHIVTFFVHPGHQRRGAGTALLHAIEVAAQQLDLQRLLAEASLTGTSFYERHGYCRTGKVLDGPAGAQIAVEKAIRSKDRNCCGGRDKLNADFS